MKNIKLLNKIAAVGTDVFCKDCYVCGENIGNPDAIMVRSADMHETAFNPELCAIARAGAGTNNIPVEKCADSGIVVFNTPGANANAVKELAVAALILAARDIAGGIKWAKTLAGQDDVAKKVEKGKSAFVGHELKGKTLGVIGLGAVGGMVANAADALGMKVIGYDPYLSVNAAWFISSTVKKASSYDELYAESDFITIHAPSTDETRGMINAAAIAKMKDGVRIVNIARADLVNTADLAAALECGKVAAYVTDFPTEETVANDKILNIPHLGASTEEAEDNCAVMAARQLVDYLENGNIVNSVNFPNVSAPRSGAARVCVLAKNSADLLAKVTAAASAAGISAVNMASGVKKDNAYIILDAAAAVPQAAADALKAVEGVIKVNIL